MLINISNTKKIAAAIDLAQMRAQVRTIHASDVGRAVRHIEQRLSGLLLKRDWTDLSFEVDPNAQDFSGYKYPPISTCFVLVRRKTGWFVTRVARDVGGRAYVGKIRGLEAKRDQIASFLLLPAAWAR